MSWAVMCLGQKTPDLVSFTGHCQLRRWQPLAYIIAAARRGSACEIIIISGLYGSARRSNGCMRTSHVTADLGEVWSGRCGRGRGARC